MKTAAIAALVSALVSATAATATTAKLITGAQIKNGSIGLVDLNAAAKRALRGQRGPQGPPGPEGPQGLTGPRGADGGFDLTKIHRVESPAVTLQPGAYHDFTVYCASGEWAISGGAFGDLFATIASLTVYNALGLVDVVVRNDDNITLDVSAHAICAAR